MMRPGFMPAYKPAFVPPSVPSQSNGSTVYTAWTDGAAMPPVGARLIDGVATALGLQFDVLFNAGVGSADTQSVDLVGGVNAVVLNQYGTWDALGLSIAGVGQPLSQSVSVAVPYTLVAGSLGDAELQETAAFIGGTNNNACLGAVNTTNPQGVYVRSIASGPVVSDGRPLPLYYAAASIDGINAVIGNDGVTTTCPFAIVGTPALLGYIGCRWGDEVPFTGILSYVRVYNVAKSGAYMAAEAAHPFVRPDTGEPMYEVPAG